MRQRLVQLLGIEVLVVFVLSLISTFSFKQLYNDGAHWAFNALNLNHPHVVEPLIRYTTVALQLPSVLANSLNANLPTAVWLFCLSYMIYPFIGLALCYLLLRKSGRESYGLIPLIILFFCIMPSWSFSVSAVNESITIALVIICYLLSRSHPNKWVTLFLSSVLIFSYEMGILFYPVFIYLLWREGKLNKTLLVSLSLFAIVVLLNLFFRILPAGSHNLAGPSFIESLKEFYMFLPLALVVLLFDWGQKRWLKALGLVGCLTYAIVICAYLMGQGSKYFWSHSYYNRVWTIPVACLVTVGIYEFLRFKKGRLSSYNLITLALLFVPQIYFEYRTVEDSALTAKKLRGYVAEQEGCIVFSKKDWKDFQQGSHIPDWSLPMLSVLYGKSFRPQSILFAEMNYPKGGALIKNNFCELQNGNIVSKDKHGPTYMFASGKFDFSEIYGVLRLN